MNKKVLTFSFATLLALVVTSCGTKVAPVSERIAKIWTASSVKENSVEVYKLGGNSNTKPGYATYKLDLSTPPTVILREVDGGTYTGKYSISGDTKLSITGLIPEPTGTGGTLDFTITSIGDTELVLTANQSYPKTGNTNNVYTLASAN
jgi:hypothetical protein